MGKLDYETSVLVIITAIGIAITAIVCAVLYILA